MLAELESRLEGINAGVKEVLMAARRAPDGPYRAVRGLVADLFHVNMEMAPLVDLALGDKSQFLVVGEDEELLEFLEREAHRFKGRVGLLPIAPRATVDAAQSPRLERTAGVVGRADQYVEAVPELAPLVRRLLGNTWIVEKLPLALQLHAQHGQGITLITLAGELLAADGSLSIGPRQGAGSLISRRSELRVLRQLIGEIESTIGQVTVSLSQLEQQMATDEEHLAELVTEHQAGRRVASLGAAAVPARPNCGWGNAKNGNFCSRLRVLAQPTNGKNRSSSRSKPVGGTAMQAPAWRPWKGNLPRPIARLPNCWPFSTNSNAGSRQPGSSWPRAKSGWKT